MTLNVTVLTSTAIYQSADFMITDLKTRKEITNKSPKTVTLTYPSWVGFITYTGIGSWRDKDVSAFIVEWLTGSTNISMAEAAEIVAAKGTQLLRDFERFYPRREHTFILAGFEDGAARVYVISNYEDCRGNTRSTLDDHLTITTRALARGKKATVVVTGRKGAVSLDSRRLLGSVAGQYPDDGLRIGRRMADLNAEAAGKSNGTVSAECVVLSFRIDGTGATRINRNSTEVPQQFPRIMNGVDVNQFMTDALKKAGFDTSKMRVLQEATATVGPGRRTLSPPAPCHYAIQIPDPSAGYTLSEISSTEFSLTRASNISDRGQIVGTGHPPGQQLNIPWSWHNGQLDRLNYTGVAQAVDNTGQIAAVLQEPHQQAALYRDGALVELGLYHGEPGVFAGTSSSAIAINSQHTVAGQVRSQTEEKGAVPNIRAAIFREGQPIVILDGIPAEYACEAVDINDRGQVLVVARPAHFDARSILWNPADGSWEYVGDVTTNVYPIALNDEGAVLGQGRNIHSQEVAFLCMPGGRWERLGTDDCWIPVDITNKGEVLGRVKIDGIDRPWLHRPTGEIALLPYATDHDTSPAAINNLGNVAGAATADRCSHAMVWTLEPSG
jgi:hypothetical protein